MNDNTENVGRPAFYTIREAARILRVHQSTLYRAVREDAFPALKIRGRYVIPAAALDRLIDEISASGGSIEPARMLAERRDAQAIRRMPGGAW